MTKPTNKMACAPSEDSDQPGHPPSLIRDFAVRSKCFDWADAQADLSLRWAHMSFCWFCHEAAQLNTSHRTVHAHMLPEWH